MVVNFSANSRSHDRKGNKALLRYGRSHKRYILLTNKERSQSKLSRSYASLDEVTVLTESKVGHGYRWSMTFSFSWELMYTNYFSWHNSCFSPTWWNGHVGIQNIGKMSLKFCIIIESKSQKDFFRLWHHMKTENVYLTQLCPLINVRINGLHTSPIPAPRPT